MFSPSLTNEQLLLFQFGVWFPLFDKHAIQGVEIQLPTEAVRFLLDDRVFVADDNAAVRPYVFFPSFHLCLGVLING